VTTNPVRAAVDLVDAEPSIEFLSALRARLLADSASVSEPVEEYIMLAPTLTRTGPNRRLHKVLAAAACVAVVAAVIVIKRSNDPQGEAGLRDVDPREALPLGQAAQITADEIGDGWQPIDDFTLADYAEQAAAINEAMPACAQLASVGLAQPTNKSVLVHQDFANGPAPMFHDVWVFATPQDASLAMDVIAGDVYPTCSLKMFDHLTALNRNITASSTSTRWENDPQIASHGERQVVFGQTIEYTFPNGRATAGAINAYVQVGRAIAFIDPQHFGDVGPNSNVEHAITISTDALKKVFGH
jgi:hypothetical protein